MIRRYQLSELSAETYRSLIRRSETAIDEAANLAAQVVNDIRREGDIALVRYAQRFDSPAMTVENLRVQPEEFAEAHRQVEPELRQAIEHAIINIKRVHQAQMPSTKLHMMEVEPGVYAGERITPIASVGLYVPRGKGSFPSVMMMLSIPAVIAGVSRIIVCTPPDKEGRVDAASLVTAELCGIHEVYKVGGAQAIAAMGLGTATIPQVAKIAGPGNTYVTAAKRMLAGEVDIGMPAGPSEAIILADEATDPRVAALDLLIEAEHGPDSAALLVTHSTALADAVEAQIPALLEQIPEWRRQFIERVLSHYGGIALTQDLADSIRFINEYAPEHLEVLTSDPLAASETILHAGEILLGHYAPITIANFCLGVNAILPTGRFARSYSCTSIHDFLKRTGFGYLSPQGFAALKGPACALADYEGFPSHALALRARPTDHVETDWATRLPLTTQETKE